MNEIKENKNLVVLAAERQERNNQLLAKIIEYKEKHASFKGITQDKEIGTAVMNLKAAYKNPIKRPKFDPIFVRKLDEIGFPWISRNHDWFEEFYIKLVEYKKVNNGFYKITQDKEISKMITRIRSAKKGLKPYKLTQEMIDKLNEIGFPWEASRYEWFDVFYNKLVAYKQKYGSFDGVTADLELKGIVGRIRSAYKGKGIFAGLGNVAILLSIWIMMVRRTVII